MRNKFPQRLRQLRKEKGITQEALGQYLHYNIQPLPIMSPAGTSLLLMIC